MNDLLEVYRILFDAFGPQHWWPARKPFEVCVGAILTQNTNWKNVEKAILNLRNATALHPARMRALPSRSLARLIRPAGCFNQKTKKLQAFLAWFDRSLAGSFANAKGVPTKRLRAELLHINGVGPETADSILLYALRRATFVVDTYTRRLLERHRLMHPSPSYDEVKLFFESRLPRSIRLFNEFHALIVMLGKTFCRPTPHCDDCPLKMLQSGNQRRNETR